MRKGQNLAHFTCFFPLRIMNHHRGGGENVFFFGIFFALSVLAKSSIFLLFFPHLDATSANEKVKHRVGSCIFKVFHAGA
jgi:hypothetical protein